MSETLDLEDRLAEDTPCALDAIVVNALYPERFDAEEAGALAALDGRGSEARAEPLSPPRSPSTAAREAQRAAGRAAARGGRRAGRTLPFLFAPELGRAELDTLSELLEDAL